MGKSATFEILRKTLDQGTREWKKFLGEVTEEQIVWQPDQGMHSIGGVLLHVMAWEAWWCEKFLAGGEIEPITASALNLSRFFDFNGKCPSPPQQPLEWYYEQLSQNRERCLLVFENLTPETKVKRGETSRSALWVYNHLTDHDSYHGGQAVLLKSQFQLRRCQ